MDQRVRVLNDHRRRQHGVFTLAQALEAKYTRPSVRRRVADGTWLELEPRAYLVAGGVEPTARQRLIALTLATGGVASGRSAAALFGLMDFPAVPEVTVVRGRRAARRAGVRSSRELLPIDLTLVDGIPTTTPVRTIIDVAATLSSREAEDLVDRSIVTGVVRATRLEYRARELVGPGRRGCRMVLRILANRHPELARARNRFEARALRLLGRAGAPPPRVNYRVRSGGRVRYLDLAWPELMILVELDGRGSHSSRRVFDDDRARQNALVVDGWTVFRLTWTALERDPDAALAAVLATIAAARRCLAS
jgi:hypothetical protein